MAGALPRPGRSGDLSDGDRRCRRRETPHLPGCTCPPATGRPAGPAVLLLHATAAAPPTEAPACRAGDRRGSWQFYQQGIAAERRPSWASAAGSRQGSTTCLHADLLDDLQGRLCVDPARVAAAGFSAGGGVVNLMACELAGRVASVASISGALYTEPGECRPSRPVPVLAIHGTNDEVVPYGGRRPTVEWPLPMPSIPAWLTEWATRNGCPGDPAVFLDTAEAGGARWSGCRDGAEVVHYRINGGTHQAPRTIAGPADRPGPLGLLRRPPLPGP